MIKIKFVCDLDKFLLVVLSGLGLRAPRSTGVIRWMEIGIKKISVSYPRTIIYIFKYRNLSMRSL